MDAGQHLLLLAGSGEARQIAQALAAQDRIGVSACLPDVPRDGMALAVPTRIGCLSGPGALAHLVRERRITAILDATHPFSENISRIAAGVSQARALPFAQVLRPPWHMARAQDVPDIAAAAALLKPGQRVFTNVGRDLLPGLARVEGVHIFARALDAAPRQSPSDNVVFVPGAAPFCVKEEETLFRQLKIDALVTKNTGSVAARGKLDAAERLGLDVILINRPEPVGDQALSGVKEALDWVAQL